MMIHIVSSTFTGASFLGDVRDFSCHVVSYYTICWSIIVLCFVV